MKTYIFAIGGTGSRVLKSLTMLLAGGVVPDTTEIIPIVIDPDQHAGDFTRTEKILKAYKDIHDEIGRFNSNNSFFQTPINYNNGNLRIDITDITDNKAHVIPFKDYIDIGKMTDIDDIGNSHPDGNSALASILFSEKNLNADMTLGFKGNPNMGSVVLNQFIGTNEFNAFTANFQQGDRIFIISSIFGGTGASGFPLLLKNLRNLSPATPNAKFIKDAKIGAVTVLPYFMLTPDTKSQIQSSTFISKTKAALSYYIKNIYKNKTNSNGIDAIYYLGDSNNKVFDNVEGGARQKNNAHFIELAAAMGIVDFINTSDGQFSTDVTIEKRYGIKNYDANSGIYFEDLDDTSKSLIAKNLSQFMLFGKYMQHINYFPKCGDNGNVWNKDGGKNQVFYGPDNKKLENLFFNLKDMFGHFNEWIDEMRNNNVSFHPFNENNDDDNDLFGFINKRHSSDRFVNTLNFIAKRNWDKMDDRLNREAKNRMDGTAQQFAEIFYLATKELLK